MEFQKPGGVQHSKLTASLQIHTAQFHLQCVGMGHDLLCCGKSQVLLAC
jgi:hypothetical protein